MIRINLLPVKSVQKKEALKGQLIVLGAALVIAGAGCATVYGSLLGRIDSQKEEISRKEAELNKLRRDIGEVAQFKRLQGELQAKLDVLDQLKTARSGPVHLLDELSRALSEKVWLTSFKEAGGTINLSGVGLNEETVAEFLRALDASPFYQGVELQVIEQVTQNNQRLQKFDVRCQAARPAASVTVNR